MNLFTEIINAYNNNIPSDERKPVRWHKFIEDLGIRHKSMSRLEITDKKKFMLARIKYGF